MDKPSVFKQLFTKERLAKTSLAGLWLFAAVALLSIAAQNILFLGLAAWLTYQWLVDKGGLVPPSIFGWWLLFMLWALLAAFMAPNAEHSITTWRKWCLVCAAWYAAQGLTKKRDLQAVLGSLLLFSGLWCLGASLIALWRPLYALLQGIPWNLVKQTWVENGDWRAVSGSGGYMVLGSCSMMVFLLFTGLCLRSAQWRKSLVWACLCSILLALVLTLTRSAWLGAQAGLAAMFLRERPRLGLGLAVVLTAFMFLFPDSPLLLRAKQSFNFQNDSTRERVYMAQAGLGIIRDHPWLGVGDSLESFDRKDENGQIVHFAGLYQKYKPEEERKLLSLKDEERGHLHNNLIQIAVMSGLPGLCLVLIFFGKLFFKVWVNGKDPDPLLSGVALGLWGALIGWWVNGLFEYNFGSFQSSFVLWFLIGLFFAAKRLVKAEPTTTFSAVI